MLGDGAGVLVLEEYEHARKRGARIYCELVGFGMSGRCLPHDRAARERRGRAALHGERLKDAGINPDEVEYVNAHGTSTPLGDLAETLAMKRAFGDHACKARGQFAPSR